MEYSFSVEKINQKSSDFILFSLIILLAGLGIATLFSASYYYGAVKFGNPRYFLNRQLLFMAAGFVLMYLVSRLQIEIIVKSIPVLLVVTLILMVMTLLPGVGKEVLGGKRWIVIGHSTFQPSELVKLTIILYLAHILSKKSNQKNDFVNGILPPFIIVTIFATLIYLQNDFSTAFFILFISLSIFFIAGIHLGYFAFIFTAVTPLTFMLLFTREHRVRRLIAFLNPSSDPSRAGFQAIAAKAALSGGGLWGKGLGLGTKKLGGLPEAHSDFVFAVLGEEAGFIGIIVILTLFLALAVRGYALGFRYYEKNPFAYYLSFGLTTSILYQALINIAVVSGVVPVTGIPLPFFSSGGSSIIVTSIMCGILLNLSRPSSSGGLK